MMTARVGERNSLWTGLESANKTDAVWFKIHCYADAQKLPYQNKPTVHLIQCPVTEERCHLPQSFLLSIHNTLLCTLGTISS